jgi:hypothetical protein
MGTDGKTPEWVEQWARDLRARDQREAAERAQLARDSRTFIARRDARPRSAEQRALADEVWQASEPFRQWVVKEKLIRHARWYWKAKIITLRNFPSAPPEPRAVLWLWWEGEKGPLEFFVEAGPRYHVKSGEGFVALDPGVLRAMLDYFRSEAPWDDVRKFIERR